MFTKSQIAQSVLVAAFLHDLFVSTRIRTKALRLLRINHNLRADLAQAEYQLSYLEQKLHDNDIELDEFDLIALHYPE